MRWISLANDIAPAEQQSSHPVVEHQEKSKTKDINLPFPPRDIIPTYIQDSIKNNNCKLVDSWLGSMTSHEIESCHDGRRRCNYSPLQLAVVSGHLEMVKSVTRVYIAYNADMHFPAGVCHESDTTALSLAIEGGHIDIVNILLELDYPLIHNLDKNDVVGSYYLSIACAHPVLNLTNDGVNVVILLLRHLYDCINKRLSANGTKAPALAKNAFIELCSILELECKPVGLHNEVTKQISFFHAPRAILYLCL